MHRNACFISANIPERDATIGKILLTWSMNYELIYSAFIQDRLFQNSFKNGGKKTDQFYFKLVYLEQSQVKEGFRHFTAQMTNIYEWKK